MTARYLIGDVRALLAELEPASVDLVLTSPPFLALRSYLPSDDPAKALEIGAEPSPGAYIDTLCEVIELVTPALAPHGSIVVELGDTYAGSGGAGGDYLDGGLRAGQLTYRQTSGWHRGTRAGREDGAAYRKAGTEAISPTGGDGWPLAKSLCLIPELFRVALVYGRNPLTGRPTPRWRARNVIRWCRPNPPVGALGDKFRPATTELVVCCRRDRRYFDLDAVRQPLADSPGNVYPRHRIVGDDARGAVGANKQTTDVVFPNPAGAPPLDWWQLPTQPYDGAHYATWPLDLCVVPIKAMCPHRVCRTCGQPSERLVKVEGLHGRDILAINGTNNRDIGLQGPRPEMPAISRTTVGWSDCGHNSWRPGLVLDPFAGSGTTLAVATGHGRDAIGFDLDARNADLALERIGPLLLDVTDKHRYPQQEMP